MAPLPILARRAGQPGVQFQNYFTMINRTLVSFLGLVFALLAGGCASTVDNGGLGDRTAVLIRNRTPKEIIDTTIAVFQEKQFQLKTSSKTEVVFEQRGSKWKEITWGGWYGDGVWERTQIKVTDYGAGAWLVEAEIKLIRDKGEEFFEDPQRLPRRAYKPYQLLLNEVQARLQGPPA